MLSFDASDRGVVADLTSREWSHPIAIMPFGDSVTYGWGPRMIWAIRGESDGYRNPLWWNFAAQHMLIDFIGPDDSGSSNFRALTMPDIPASESISLSACQWADADVLPAFLADGDPAAILLMAGTNDVTQETAPQNTVGQEIRNILNSVARRSPLIHVYVATLPPISPSTRSGEGDQRECRDHNHGPAGDSRRPQCQPGVDEQPHAG
jgi:lysophospholipase L1-like esterase